MTPVSAHVLALLSYALASGLYGSALALKKRPAVILPRCAMALAIALHTAAIGYYCAQTKLSPFESTFGTLSITAWIIALVSTPVEIAAKAPAIGSLAAPACSITLLVGLLRSGGDMASKESLRATTTTVHVLLALLSLALFAVAAASALLYLWQYRSLKRPSTSAWFRRLPPLTNLDQLSFNMVAIAMPLLTVSIVLGVTRALATGEPAWRSDPHTIVSLLAWVVYSAYLTARITKGIRGHRVQWVLVAGAGLCLLIYVLPSATHTLLGLQGAAK